jgi:hypothetical protein
MKQLMIYYRSAKGGKEISTDDIDKAHDWWRDKSNGIHIFESTVSKRNIDYMEGFLDALKLQCKNIVYENITEHKTTTTKRRY